jgi:hypothetical protein
MANVTYTTLHAITAQTRAQACASLADMLQHLTNLGLDLVSIVVNPDRTVTVVLTGLIRADHAGFWDLGAGV